MDGVEVSVMGWSSMDHNINPCTHLLCVKQLWNPFAYCEPWDGLSATCTSHVSTLLSHHLCASTRNGGCLNIRCVSFSSPSAYRGGSVGCVSSLSSPQWMMWPVLVMSRSCFLSPQGRASSGYAHLSRLKAAMIC